MMQGIDNQTEYFQQAYNRMYFLDQMDSRKGQVQEEVKRVGKQRERWTKEEHGIFLNALQHFGRDWRKISAAIGSKTTVQVRTHAYGYFAKVQNGKSVGYVPPKGKGVHATLPIQSVNEVPTVALSRENSWERQMERLHKHMFSASASAQPTGGEDLNNLFGSSMPDNLAMFPELASASRASEFAFYQQQAAAAASAATGGIAQPPHPRTTAILPQRDQTVLSEDTRAGSDPRIAEGVAAGGTDDLDKKVEAKEKPEGGEGSSPDKAGQVEAPQKEGGDVKEEEKVGAENPESGSLSGEDGDEKGTCEPATTTNNASEGGGEDSSSSSSPTPPENEPNATTSGGATDGTDTVASGSSEGEEEVGVEVEVEVDVESGESGEEEEGGDTSGVCADVDGDGEGLTETGRRRRERWTKEEHAMFLQGLAKFGRKWKKIQTMVTSKTVVQVRTHAYGYFAKLARHGIDQREGSALEVAHIIGAFDRSKATGEEVPVASWGAGGGWGGGGGGKRGREEDEEGQGFQEGGEEEGLVYMGEEGGGEGGDYYQWSQGSPSKRSRRDAFARGDVTDGQRLELSLDYTDDDEHYGGMDECYSPLDSYDYQRNGSRARASSPRCVVNFFALPGHSA